MVGLDEAALICDFAETYHVYNWRTLPAKTAATLAMGLRPSSRIMLKMNSAPAPVDISLLAIIADCLRILVWRETKDGAKGRNAPESLIDTLYGSRADKETQSFDTAAAFHSWRDSMLGGRTDE